MKWAELQVEGWWGTGQLPYHGIAPSLEAPLAGPQLTNASLRSVPAFFKSENAQNTENLVVHGNIGQPMKTTAILVIGCVWGRHFPSHSLSCVVLGAGWTSGLHTTWKPLGDARRTSFSSSDELCVDPTLLLMVDHPKWDWNRRTQRVSCDPALEVKATNYPIILVCLEYLQDFPLFF